MTIDKIDIGQSASFTKTITETDIYLFAGITGDLNPAHINEQFAKDTIFKTRIAHGGLISGLISTVLGMYLPGPGTIYLKQDTKFLAPVKIGDTVTATVKAKEKYEEKNRILFDCEVTNQDNIIVIKGEALVMPPKI